MTKAEVVAEIANRTGMDKPDVSSVLEAYFRVIKNSLAQGESVYFRGFGSFTLKLRAKKIGRVISENRSIVIPAHYIPSFKPAQSFVDKVKESVKVEKAPA